MATTLGRCAVIAPLLLAAVAASAQAPGPFAPDDPDAREHFSPAPPGDPDAEVAPEIPGDQHAEDAPQSPQERLDDLFAALRDSPEGAHTLIQRRIAELWSRSGSDSMDLLLARGREAIDQEEYGKAVEHLSALTDLAPEFAEGWNALATAHFLADDYWRSVLEIQRTLTLEPRHFGALSGLGVILERVGDEAGALAAFREALRINPHLDNAREAIERLEPKVDGRDI